MRSVLRLLQRLSDNLVHQRRSSENRHSQLTATSRLVFSVTIEEHHVVSRPSSEFGDNIIAEDVVAGLEIGVDCSVEHREVFGVANRTLDKALDRISISCASRDRLSPRYTVYALSFGPICVHS